MEVVATDQGSDFKHEQKVEETSVVQTSNEHGSTLETRTHRAIQCGEVRVGPRKLRTTEREEENHELNVQGCIAHNRYNDRSGVFSPYQGIWHQHHVCLAV